MWRVIVSNVVFVLGLVVALAVTVDFASALDAPWKFLVVGALVVAALAQFFLDVRGALHTGIRRFAPRRNQQEKIRAFMVNLIRSSSSCAVFSRDLTWAVGEAADALRTHARSNSLTLLLPKATELSSELERLGATVCYYPTLDYVVHSRFTIVNADSTSVAVAVGRRKGKDHIIETVTGTEHAAFMLAQDLFNVIRRMKR